MTLNGALALLNKHLSIHNQELTDLVVCCFSDYVRVFLVQHPQALDPDCAQIQMRVRLTLAHGGSRWLWTQTALEARQAWTQDEHATAFILEILTHISKKGLVPKNGGIDAAVEGLHKRLSLLQSLWLGNGVWIEDPQLRKELRDAVMRALATADLNRVAYG